MGECLQDRGGPLFCAGALPARKDSQRRAREAEAKVWTCKDPEPQVYPKALGPKP